MAFDNRDKIDFGKNDIPQLFRSLFIPTLLGMLFNVAFMLTDGIFVGHGVGANGLACVNLVAPIMMVVTGFGMMFGIGSSVVGAIHLSQNNEKAARINVTQAYVACVVFAVLMGVGLYCFADSILHFLGVSHNLMAMAKNYYVWFIPTCLFLMFQIVGEFVIRLDGSPRYAMYANIIPAIVNIIFDYVFIFPCGWGLMGAALATDIGTGVGALMTLYYMLFRSEKLRFYRLKHTWVSIRLTLRNIGYMMRLGFSAFVGEFAISVMMLTGNLVFGHYLGDAGIAAYSVICYLFPVVFMIYNAAAQSAQPIISFNYGAHATDRATHTFRHSTIVSMVFGAVVTAIFCLFPNTIIGVFLDNTSEAYTLASAGLPLFSLGFVIVAFNISTIGYLQSVERATLATLLMALRGIIILVVAFVLLPKLLDVPGLWLAAPLSELLTAIVGIIIIKGLSRE